MPGFSAKGDPHFLCLTIIDFSHSHFAHLSHGLRRVLEECGFTVKVVLKLKEQHLGPRSTIFPAVGDLRGSFSCVAQRANQPACLPHKKVDICPNLIAEMKLNPSPVFIVINTHTDC